MSYTPERFMADSGITRDEVEAEKRRMLEEIRLYELKEARKAEHVTQKRLAQALGVSQKRISVIESGDAAAMAQAGFKVGDRVCALVAGGGYAEYCVAPVAQCLPVPRGLTDVEAASLPETFFTVWSNVFDRGRLQKGETLLVQGGTSGIGVTAIQLGKAAGATVIVTAGSDEKCAAALDLGADHAINYKATDFAEEAKKLTGGQGVDVILDMVAGDYVKREVECLAEDGRLVIIAVQGGIKAEFNAGLVLRRRLTITGSTLRPRPVAFKGAIAQALKKTVWPWLESGVVKPVIHSVFAASEAGDGLPSGAAIVLALGAFFLLSALASPRYGVIARLEQLAASLELERTAPAEAVAS